MFRLDTEIEISATPERVWSLLLNFPAYPRWNPFVRSIEGTPGVGHALNVFVQPPGSRGMRFRPTVLAVEPCHELRWKGKLWVPGLFDGEHYFRLEPRPHGRLMFRHGEIFSGLLVPVLRGSLNGSARHGFVAMNEALKREAELR